MFLWIVVVTHFKVSGRAYMCWNVVVKVFGLVDERMGEQEHETCANSLFNLRILHAVHKYIHIHFIKVTFIKFLFITVWFFVFSF